MFIEKTFNQANLSLIDKEVTDIELQTEWYNNQIGLTHRADATNIWNDAVGSLYSVDRKEVLGKEKDFTEWNLNDSEIKHAVEILSKNLNLSIGRVRLMKLLPKTGLSVHRDSEFRFHLAIRTNPHAYICNNINGTTNSINVIAQCYHLPSDSYWYKVDTRQIHWVYNGGKTERIHLVVCAN